MGEELLSLRWNNHQSHFVDILTFLREQEIFIDVTLACGGKLYPAHKFVLSTCSEYFKQMFTKNPNKHPIVFMKDVLCKDLEALLDFMYHGEVNVPQSNLGSLIKTAEGLQIKGLAVPDDPPLSKRDSNAKDKRGIKSSDNTFTPTPKRLRISEKSPNANHSSKRKSVDNSDKFATEDPIDDDSRNSIHSSLSDTGSKPNHNSHIENNVQDSSHGDNGSNLPSRNDSSPGPSGLKPSKEEEVEIKQEEVVDLGDDDMSDWGHLDTDGRESGLIDGMGSGSFGPTSEATPNFSDLLSASTDDPLNSSSTGDPAMGQWNAFGSEFTVTRQRNRLYDAPRPHRCAFCDKCFKRSEHKRQHERLHTGEKPYSCSRCGAKFPQASGLYYHKFNCCVTK